MRKFFFGANIGGCPHTEGLYKAARIAKLAGFDSFIQKPNSSIDSILEAIHKHNPDFVGFSYRLSPSIGISELKKTLTVMDIQGLLNKQNGTPRKIAFAGLPETLQKLEHLGANLRVPIFKIAQLKDPVKQLNLVLDFFEVGSEIREYVLQEIREELFPPRIELLDQLADEVILNENYRLLPPLNTPSEKAKYDLIHRMRKSSYPLIRSHFGIPSESIKPTVEGITALANARVIDEVSIGSSDLSQRFYNKPEEFLRRKNDGGVPYKDFRELRELYLASRTGNYPSCKPYAHTTGICDFIDDCVRAGHLIGAHQAIPLYWFNQLDGRGSTPVRESIIEHVQAVQKLAMLGIPVEMNDPNQWSSRWAHDTIVASDYGIIGSVMLENGVKNIILQMQFSKPVETSDFADIAKFKVGSSIVQKLNQQGSFIAAIHHETRTGIESFSTDLTYAKWQLARSTLLQLFLRPSIIHLVSYCEAVRAATVDDIVESSQIIRRAVDIFRINEYDIRQYEQNSLITERVAFLTKECDYLLKRIARLDKHYDKHQQISKSLSKPEVIFESIANGYMTAPGIMLPEFKQEKLVTKPMKNGYFNAVSFETGELLTERERLENIEGHQ